MPEPPLKPCAYPNCRELVRKGMCALHRRQTAFVRDPERKRLYGHAWRRLRKAWLAEHPWCEECFKQGFYVQAEQVHHRVPHRGDVDVFWESPLESLCASCHSRKTAGEMHKKKDLKRY
jgi:5-methylcytosine-specific restriction protein A